MTQSQHEKKPRKQATPTQSPTVKQSPTPLGATLLMAQQAVDTPAQANPRNLLNLQRVYGNQAVSGLIQTRRMELALSQPVQRTEKDGQPDALPAIFNPDVFTDRTTKATWKSEGYHRTIIVWLEAVKKAETWAAQQDALNHVAEACDAWLDKFGAEEKPKEAKPKEAASTTGRRPHIYYLKQMVAARISAAPTGTSVGTGEVAGTKQQAPTNTVATEETLGQNGTKDEKSNEVIKTLGEGSDVISSGAGITGSFNDVNVNLNDKTKDGTWGKEGAKNLNRAEFDLLEGANMLGGLAKMFGVKKVYKEGETKLDKATAVGQGGEGLGQVAHGATKFTKGVGLKDLGSVGDDKAKEAAAANWTQVGDSGAACADGLAFISGVISFGRSLLSAEAVTGKEKVDKGLDVAANVTSTARSGVSTALDIVKAATKGGPKDAIAGLGTAAGALGIVSGIIDMAQGALQMWRASSAMNDLQQAEAKVGGALGPVFERLKNLAEKLGGLPKEELVAIFKVRALLIELEKLKNIFAEMQKLSQAMQSMRKIQNRRMEEGAFKMAKGGTAVVSGILLVTGAGAPIGVAVAALAGIMALGKAGVQWRRNAAASRLNSVALRLTEGGQPKVKPDSSEPDYRTMEKRIYKCYYTHLPEVILEKTPPGLTNDQFLDVKRFSWSEKRERVNFTQTIPYNKAADIPTSDNEEVRNNWLVLNEEKGKVKKEAPTGTSFAKLMLTASAHKSKQSMETSKTEVVDALYMLGSQSWNQEKQSFVDAPIVPQGEADPDTMKEVKSITLQALLKAADINAVLWKKWLAASKGDEKKMKELIGSKLG